VRSGLACALLGALGCSGGSTGEVVPKSAPLPAAARSPRPLAPELQAAVRAAKEQRFETAQQLAREYVDAHPSDGQANFLLGMTHYWTGNYGAARPWLEEALRLEPDTHVIHDSLGYCLFMLGDMAGARREYEAFRAAVPDDPKVHYGLGLLELEASRLEEAATLFRRAIALFEALDAEERAARQSELAECHARLGEVHFARGDYAAARTQLVHATTLYPGNISAFYTLSLVHRRLGEEALADQAAGRYESARRALVAGQKAR
jgi:Flp pilus assembly protein TadD